jgi:hypothetical protein
LPESTRTRFIAEMLGLVGLIASLGFVAMEIRQNTTAVRSATIQAISDQAMELTLSMATDDRLPRLVYEMTRGGITEADLSGEDYMRLRLAVVAGLRRQENLYLQVQNGVLPRAALGNVSFSFYTNAFAREIWATDSGRFDAGFAQYWSEVMTER